MHERKSACRVLIWKPKKKMLRRRKRRWEDNITMDTREIGRDGVNWVHLALDVDISWVFVKTVMNFRVAENAVNLLSGSERFFGFLRRISFHGISSLFSHRTVQPMLVSASTLSRCGDLKWHVRTKFHANYVSISLPLSKPSLFTQRF
jgi:hypothetical protein